MIIIVGALGIGNTDKARNAVPMIEVFNEDTTLTMNSLL